MMGTWQKKLKYLKDIHKGRGSKMTEKISLELNFEGRECYSVPMSIEIDFDEHLERTKKEGFNPSSIRMVDKMTGKTVPCQFSPSDSEKLRGTLSWILVSHAQKRLEIVVGGKKCCCQHLKGVEMWDRGDGQMEIFVNEEHVTSYIYNEAYERPFLYPVIGPDGLPVTRSLPCFGDHPHHKGIGLAIGDVSGERGKPGINFWALGNIGDPRQGRVIHKKFTNLEQGPVYAKIQEENIWKQNDELPEAYPWWPPERSRWKIKREGAVLMKETRTVTIWNVSPMRLIDIHTVMIPAVDEVILNADVEKKEMAKENGPLTIRVADNMRGAVEGTIVNSQGGRTEKECWGRQARWVDYYGPVVPGGPVNGIAAMDHPKNVRHPTGWHVRDYGLFAANPFYDKKPEWPDQGPIYLFKAKGDKLDLRHRIYIHRGNEKEGMVEQKWQDWVKPPQVTIQ